MALNIIKLVVGCDTVEDLIAWRRPQAGEPWILRTRMTPKRTAELLDGGSVYRVFKGMVLCRQRILEINTIGEGPEARCHMTLDETVVRTHPLPRRPFQGWRYFDGKDAPADLDGLAEAGAVPQDLAVKLRELGAW
jgi:hypothetical protein